MSLHASISQAMRLFRDDERGAAMVEFAIILPILLLFFAVTIEGARMMWSYQSAAAAVRDASRFAARSAPANICTLSVADQAGVLADESFVQYITEAAATSMFGVEVNSVTPSLKCIEGAYRRASVGIMRVTATITVTYPFGAIFGYGADNPRTGFTATVSDEHRVFGT